MGHLKNVRTAILVVAMLLSLSSLAIPRPVSAATDFTVMVNPASVTIPLGYWAGVMLTVSSTDGMQGLIVLNVPVGGSTGLVGSGYSTGWTLPAGGNFSTVIWLSPGPVEGNYIVPIGVTIGTTSHIYQLPMTLAPVSGPDFITRLWGSYSILQGWNSTVQNQMQVTSLGGFSGQVALSASVEPNIPDAPIVSFHPSLLTVPAGGSSSYVTGLSAGRETPTGDYVVTVTATSGTITHSYSAILSIGDYRPQPTEPPTDNATITTPTNQASNGAFRNNLSPVSSLSPVLDVLRSFWWLQAAAGAAMIVFLCSKRKPVSS